MAKIKDTEAFAKIFRLYNNKKTECSIHFVICTLYRSQFFEPRKRIFTDNYKIKMLYSRLHIFLMIGTCFSC